MRAIGVLALGSAAVLSAAACGSRAGSGTDVTGSIDGVIFKAQDAYATRSESASSLPPPKIWSVVVVVAQGAGTCAPQAGGTAIQVSIERRGSAVESGTYAADGGAPAGVVVTALLQRTDATGRAASFETASRGSVTVDVLDTQVRGTLSLGFPDGSVEGTFVAPFCGAPDAGSVDAEAATDADGGTDADADAGTGAGTDSGRDAVADVVAGP